MTHACKNCIEYICAAFTFCNVSGLPSYDVNILVRNCIFVHKPRWSLITYTLHCKCVRAKGWIGFTTVTLSWRTKYYAIQELVLIQYLPTGSTLYGKSLSGGMEILSGGISGSRDSWSWYNERKSESHIERNHKIIHDVENSIFLTHKYLKNLGGPSS